MNPSGIFAATSPMWMSQTLSRVGRSSAGTCSTGADQISSRVRPPAQRIAGFTTAPPSSTQNRQAVSGASTPSGAVSTSGTLNAGDYTVSGTDADGFGDTGTWTFTLHVTAVTIAQGNPTSD